MIQVLSPGFLYHSTQSYDKFVHEKIIVLLIKASVYDHNHIGR